MWESMPDTIKTGYLLTRRRQPYILAVIYAVHSLAMALGEEPSKYALANIASSVWASRKLLIELLATYLHNIRIWKIRELVVHKRKVTRRVRCQRISYYA